MKRLRFILFNLFLALLLPLAGWLIFLNAWRGSSWESPFFFFLALGLLVLSAMSGVYRLMKGMHPFSRLLAGVIWVLLLAPVFWLFAFSSAISGSVAMP